MTELHSCPEDGPPAQLHQLCLSNHCLITRKGRKNGGWKGRRVGFKDTEYKKRRLVPKVGGKNGYKVLKTMEDDDGDAFKNWMVDKTKK